MFKPIIDHTSSPLETKIIDFELGHVGRMLPYNEELYFVKWFSYQYSCELNEIILGTKQYEESPESIIKVSEGFYNKNNNKHGLHIYYYSDGNKKIERQYKNGVIHGKEICYMKNGHIYYIHTYDEGILHGETIIMNELTNVISKKLHYNYGILHGLQEVFSNGVLTQTVEYFNGFKNGLESHYNLAGKLMIRFQWKDNKKHGNYNEYYPNGGLRFICQFIDDILNGTFVELDPTGKQISRKLYLNGIAIKEIIS